MRREHQQPGRNHDPTHPSLRLASEIADRIHTDSENGSLNLGDIKAILDDLGLDAEMARAAFLSSYLGNCDGEENKKTLKNIFCRLTRDEHGNKVSASAYSKNIERLFSFVFTGHPTFGKHPDRAQALADYSSHLAGSKNYGPETKDRLLESAQLEYKPPTLEGEWKQALASMKNAHAAIDVVEDMAIEVAMEEYPEEWMHIDCAPATLGTWLYFDWDGRKDITWNKLFQNRFHLQELMLEDHLVRLRVLQGRLQEGNAGDVSQIIDQFSYTSSVVAAERFFYADYNQKDDADFTKLQARYKEFIATKERRVMHPGASIAALNEILQRAVDPETQRQLVKLRSRLANHGLSFAHPHFRISSASVSAALQEAAEINIGDEESTDNKYAEKIETLIVNAKPESSNIIDVAQAGATIIKQMAMIRQFIDDLDSHCPTRFLVAETHNASTIKAALYFARRFGVGSHINVSPLFEDRIGGERGDKIMRILYRSKAYQDHVSGERPHNPMQRAVFIENGYSDSGRYDNQFAAGSFIERNNIRIVRTHGNNPNMHNLPLVRFDTHGHFMGRGMHPGGVRETQQYLFTRHFLSEAKQKNIKLALEESFQGEGGFLVLGTPDSCLAVLTRTLEYITDDHSSIKNDSYYNSGQRSALAIFEQVRGAYSDLKDRPEFVNTIGTFEALMPPSGSRPAKGQYDAGRQKQLPRAIRHNGTHSQLGLLTNIAFGVGSAIKADEDAYAHLAQNSPEFRQTRLALVVKALALSDPGIHEAYAELYNPRFWIERARHTSNAVVKERNYRVADFMRELDYYKQFSAVSDQIRQDVQRTMDAHERLEIADHPDFDKATMKVSLTQKANMAIIHGARMSAIIELFTLAVSIPGISSRNDIDADQVIRRIMHFDREAIQQLHQVFVSQSEGQKCDFPPKPSELTLSRDYSHLNASLTRPMEECISLIKHAAHGISDYMLGVG